MNSSGRKLQRLLPVAVLLLITLLILRIIPKSPHESIPSLESRIICKNENCVDTRSITHLIIVPGHSVLTNPSDLTSESSWVLMDYQKGQLPTLFNHMRSAVTLAATDPSSLLVFSGGQSRVQGGPMSEGLSYWLACKF
jgi:hypothetical protein